jgi:hypothetical protein
MKILILGRGKSGTTGLLFKVAGGIPNCHAFSGGRPGKFSGDYENVVFKHTHSEKKGKTFNLYQELVAKENFDRKIWMARDPRDVAVSRMLFRWHKGHKGLRKQYRKHLDLVEKKEQDPQSIPFHELYSCIYQNDQVLPLKELVEKERRLHQRMSDFVKSAGSKWYVFKYEDMIRGNFDALNEYLGYDISSEAQVPTTTRKSKVVRKKTAGDWRHWFTEVDVENFKLAYLPYMETIGYDCEDWAISSNPVIEPRYSSLYIKRLFRKNRMNKIKKNIFRPFRVRN